MATNVRSDPHYCSCGELTENYYNKSGKCNGRQTHQPAGKHRQGKYNRLTKVCPKCSKRYTICEHHPTLGFQPWTMEQRAGRFCKADMWILKCHICTTDGTNLSEVLCPGCKAPFANKGPKWYLELEKKCKWANNRSKCYKQMEKQIKCLLTLGELPEDIIEKLKNLSCMPKPVKSEPESAVKTEEPMPEVIKPAGVASATASPSVTASPGSVTKIGRLIGMESGYNGFLPVKRKAEHEEFGSEFSDILSAKNHDYDFLQLEEFYFPDTSAAADDGECLEFSMNRRKRKRVGRNDADKREELDQTFSLLCNESLSVIL